MNPALLLMGVSGSGKTTIGQALAAHWNCPFWDADDFHPASNREKMRAGLPLDDQDRQPWLDALSAQLRLQGQAPFVLACSALRERYRSQLQQACPHLQIVWLHGDPTLIDQRLRSRQNHFMPASLLQSQLDALEPPNHARQVDIALPIDQIVTQLLQHFSA
jgi:gluconokinase